MSHYKRVDWPVFIAAFVVLLLVCGPLIVFPHQGERLLGSAQKFITHELGAIFLWAGLAAVGFLIWLSCSRFGAVKLAHNPDETPEYSTSSWAAMLFCTGVTSSVIYWGSIEWAIHYYQPPFDVEKMTPAAAEWAVAYGFFHWGLTGWAFYCIPVLPVAYAYYVRRRPALKISEACRGILGNHVDGLAGRIIDVIFMFGVLGTAGTTLALSSPLLTGIIEYLFGIQSSLWLEVVVVLLCAGIAGISVGFGLKQGIRRLSNINIVLALGLLIFIFILGPTVFILEMATDGLGLMFNEFIRMSTWTDTVRKTEFPQGWTMFYWAWWVVSAPIMGLFTAKISRGRTIRQVVFGMLFFGSLAAWVGFSVLGGYSMSLQLSGQSDIMATLVQNNQISYGQIPAAILQGFEQLPLAPVIMGILFIVCAIFLSTSFDSNAYTLALAASHKIPEDEDPAYWHRTFWALALALLPITLLFIGGLKSVQTASLVTAIPVLIIGIVMVAAFMKELKQDWS